MKRILLLFFLLSLSLPVFAEKIRIWDGTSVEARCLPLMAQAPVCLEGAERGKAMASILKANDIRTSLQFRFVMTRHSALLTEALKSRGKAYYIYPDKVRWEVEQPRPSVFVLNGATTTDRRQQTLLRNVSKIAEKGLVNEADFTVKVYQTPN